MPRSARRLRFTEAACYHVLNRGHAREAIFHDDEDRTCFLRLLARYRDRFGVALYHYCLMGNHFHLVLRLPEPGRLSPLVAGLLVAYWHHYRRRMQRQQARPAPGGRGRPLRAAEQAGAFSSETSTLQ